MAQMNHLKKNLCHSVFLMALLMVAFLPAGLHAEPVDEPPEKSRCAVCGMFVGQYQDWLTQVRFTSGRVEFFDGVKDMMAFIHNPKKYGAERLTISEIWVSDYYSLEWINGREALYVIGSDVYGPMGHELIPFATMEAARSFSRDHHGKKIVPYSEITDALIEELRSGQRMK